MREAYSKTIPSVPASIRYSYFKLAGSFKDFNSQMFYGQKQQNSLSDPESGPLLGCIWYTLIHYK